MDINIEKAHEYCRLNLLNPDTYIRIAYGDYAGNGYHTTILALAIKRFDALDTGFSPHFLG